MISTKFVTLRSIHTAVAKCYLDSLRRGSDWFAVRVSPEGEIYQSLEASPCYSEGEYFGREPHTVTIYEVRGQGDLDEAEIEEEADALDLDWLELNLPERELAEKLKGAGLILED